MRQMVLDHEIAPMKSMVDGYKGGYQAKMTVIVVNKKINQRFF